MPSEPASAAALIIEEVEYELRSVSKWGGGHDDLLLFFLLHPPERQIMVPLSTLEILVRPTGNAVRFRATGRTSQGFDRFARGTIVVSTEKQAVAWMRWISEERAKLAVAIELAKVPMEFPTSSAPIETPTISQPQGEGKPEEKK